MENLHHHYDGLGSWMPLADTMPTRPSPGRRCRRIDPGAFALGGVPAVQVIELLAAEQGVELVDVEAIAAAKEALFLELIGDVQPIVPVKMIAALHKEHIPLAVATGSETWVAEKILGALGILDWFDAVVGADQIEHPKPAADTYLRAAELLGVDPRRCHAFEDTRLGMDAAEAAGMAVIDINGLR